MTSRFQWKSFKRDTWNGTPGAPALSIFLSYGNIHAVTWRWLTSVGKKHPKSTAGFYPHKTSPQSNLSLLFTTKARGIFVTFNNSQHGLWMPHGNEKADKLLGEDDMHLACPLMKWSQVWLAVSLLEEESVVNSSRVSADLWWQVTWKCSLTFPFLCYKRWHFQ
jgi:hypothetical protein